MTFSVCIDVPNLADGIRFYSRAFGFRETANPFEGVALLKASGQEVCLLEKAEGSAASNTTDDTRRYGRHWTPVHLDFLVADLDEALRKATAAGAIVEEVHRDSESIAFCCDPFGHGFCLIEHPEKKPNTA